MTEKDAGKFIEDGYCTEENKMIKLTLTTLDKDKSAKRIVLQDDKVQPKSRQCSFGYVIEKVIALDKSIVVVLSYLVPDFEGPSNVHMVVTAKLP